MVAGEFVPDQSSERQFRPFPDSRPVTTYLLRDVPFVTYYRYPYSPFPGYSGTHHRVVVADPLSVVNYLANNERWFSQAGNSILNNGDESDDSDAANERDEANNSDEDDHDRRKRQATFDLGMQAG